ncbi:hypothetical protein CDAR_471001 [Caerostris darwini]|uniref:Uncharacterized protein n=1 Tax=Caerostris darwini TaxID=1538125 RepID=A0AAV4RG30_9ARAC|nr:hypothetical protein CDAR_471001 [Caerostris darwini]
MPYASTSTSSHIYTSPAQTSRSVPPPHTPAPTPPASAHAPPFCRSASPLRSLPLPICRSFVSTGYTTTTSVWPIAGLEGYKKTWKRAWCVDPSVLGGPVSGSLTSGIAIPNGEEVYLNIAEKSRN